MNTVQEFWDSYCKNVVPPDASSVQTEECRRAFYAGAFSMLGLLERIGEPDVSEDAGVSIIQGWQEELTAFAREVGK